MSERTTWKSMAAVMLVCALCAGDAAAWGAKALQSIAIAAMRQTRDQFPEAFGKNGFSFERDVIRGILDGTNRMRQWHSINNDAHAMAVIDSEIQLLRRARQFGIDSYYCYRLGVVGGLVADLAIPVSIAYRDSDQGLVDRMNGDIDLELDKLLYVPRGSRIYVRAANEYLATVRKDFGNLSPLIISDYQHGTTEKGILRNGLKTHYNNAIEAVADVWYTVLRNQGDPSDIRASDELLIRYLIHRIDYILNIRHNTADAERAYREFTEVQPKDLESFEAVGDILYSYGPETRDRGVREWQRALDFPGRNRQRVVQKLGNHYLTVGEEHLAKAAEDAKSRDRAYSEAVDAFTNTLKYDRTNQRAADLLSQTKSDIRARETERETQISIISGAEKVLQQAEEMKKVENFAGAIQAYTQASSLLSAVSPEFPEEFDGAQRRADDVSKELNRINTSVIDKARELIAQGDREVDNKKFDDAINLYGRVGEIVQVVPEAQKVYYEQGQKLVTEAEDKKKNAERERQRFEEQQRALQGAAPQ